MLIGIITRWATYALRKLLKLPMSRFGDQMMVQRYLELQTVTGMFFVGSARLMFGSLDPTITNSRHNQRRNDGLASCRRTCVS